MLEMHVFLINLAWDLVSKQTTERCFNKTIISNKSENFKSTHNDEKILEDKKDLKLVTETYGMKMNIDENIDIDACIETESHLSDEQIFEMINNSTNETVMDMLIENEINKTVT